MDLDDLLPAQRKEHEENEKQEENEKLIRVGSRIFSVLILLMCLVGLWLLVTLGGRF